MKCAQCNQPREPESFIGKLGVPTLRCSICREAYGKDYGIRASVPRRLLRTYAEAPRVTFALRSGNKKLGKIPAATVSPETCPPSCGFYGKGCYPEFGAMGHHWRNVEHNGLDWEVFLGEVRALPKGQLWRYAVAGDLPGNGEDLDHERIEDLIEANVGRRGFTMTHKRLTPRFIALLRLARFAGFTVNLSADTLAEADEKAAYGVAPVVVVMPLDATGDVRTPAGRRVVMCPAETRGLTCKECQLCSVSNRKGIVGFRAHGQMKKTVSRIARGYSV